MRPRRATTTVDALGIAGSRPGDCSSSSPPAPPPSSCTPASPRTPGILAARLAAAGADGPDTVLEGDRAASTPRSADGPRPTPALVDSPASGERWETTRIGIKPYPACQLMHAALDAGRQALLADGRSRRRRRRGRSRRGPPRQRRDRVRAPRQGRARARRTTRSSRCPWSLAALLVDGEVTVDTYDAPTRSAAPDVADARRPGRVVEVPDDAGVAADAPGRVEVDARATAQRLDRRGRPQRRRPDDPLDDERCRQARRQRRRARRRRGRRPGCRPPHDLADPHLTAHAA